MSDVTVHAPGQAALRAAKVLLYSDDATVREQVQFAVGPLVGGREVRWTESATHAAVIGYAESSGFDLIVLDAEAAKVGGMGICRQLKHELFACPPILLLVGRPQDAWLATWSEADGAVSHPLDPFEVKAAVDALLQPDGAPSATAPPAKA